MLVCISCLLLFLILFMVWPWLESQPAATQGGSLKTFEDYRQLFNEREALLESLKDLEVDFQTGKLSPEDRESLQYSLSEKLMVILKQIENLEGSDPFLVAVQEDLKERLKAL
jgi:hypothetical protein